MPTLKTTIMMNSSSLFPTPINMTLPVIQPIDGNHTGFQTVIIPADSGSTLYTSVGVAGDSGSTYFFAQAAATNIDTISISITKTAGADSLVLAILNPGDIMYVPIAATDATSTIIAAGNDSVTTLATLSYFYGERG